MDHGPGAASNSNIPCLEYFERADRPVGQALQLFSYGRHARRRCPKQHNTSRSLHHAKCRHYRGIGRIVPDLGEVAER
jgi:hypothetical protein